MSVVQRLSDRLLGCFVPKVEASAFWYDQYFCVNSYCVIMDPFQQSNQQKIRCNCHDSTDYCTDCTLVSCTC